MLNMSFIVRKPTFWFPTWSDTNQGVHLKKMARGCREAELRTTKLICVFVFAYVKRWFSHDAAQLLIVKFPITFYIAKQQSQLPGLGPLIIIPGGILGRNPGGGMFIPGGGPPGWPGGGTEKKQCGP